MDRKESLARRLREFKRKTSRHFKIEKMIFFGSRALGKPHRDSDVDLIIVSSSFRGLNFFQRGAKMYNYWSLRMPVDFLCYTPEEFNRLKKQITVVNEALKKGIDI